MEFYSKEHFDLLEATAKKLGRLGWNSLSGNHLIMDSGAPDHAPMIRARVNGSGKYEFNADYLDEYLRRLDRTGHRFNLFGDPFMDERQTRLVTAPIPMYAGNWSDIDRIDFSYEHPFSGETITGEYARFLEAYFTFLYSFLDQRHGNWLCRCAQLVKDEPNPENIGQLASVFRLIKRCCPGMKTALVSQKEELVSEQLREHHRHETVDLLFCYVRTDRPAWAVPGEVADKIGPITILGNKPLACCWTHRSRTVARSR